MATARRMPQNIDVLDALTDKLTQNENTTEIDGNVEIDGDLKVNGQIIGGGGGGIDTLINTDLTYGDVTVDYNTTDGMTITGTMRQTYEGGNHDSTMDLEIPIVPGKGIVIDKQSDKEQVGVKVDINSAVSHPNANYAIFIGNGSNKPGNYSVTVGNGSFANDRGVAIGQTAQAGNPESIAIGYYTATTNDYLHRMNISIGKELTNTASDCILLGEFNDDTFTGDRFVLADGTGSSDRHNYFKITKDDNDVYHMFLNDTEVPTQTKTLFGDKSIVGSGNIDLYRHNIHIAGETADKEVWCNMIVISSKNTVVDSLTDLYTLCNGMGDLLPISGLCKTTDSPKKGPAILCRATASGGIYWIDSNNQSRLYNWSSMPTLTITDTLTTI